MTNPDIKSFDISVQDPEALFKKAEEQFKVSAAGGRFGIVSADLASLYSEEGLFSGIKPSLALYYPSRNITRNGFALFLRADYLTQDSGCWSDSEMSRLQQSLRRMLSDQEVAISQFGRYRRPQLFVFDRPLALRLHADLGYRDNPHYNPKIRWSTTLALDAGLTRSLQGSPDNIIPFGPQDDFIQKVQAGTSMMTAVINGMYRVRQITQPPQALILTIPYQFF